MEKRKITYLRIFNRYLKENNAYDKYWEKLRDYIKEARAENYDISWNFAYRQYNNIINVGSIREFSSPFNFHLYYGNDYDFWKPISDNWYTLIRDFYDTHFKKKKKEYRNLVSEEVIV